MFRSLKDPNWILRILFEGLRYFILMIIIIGMLTEDIFIDRMIIFIYSILIVSNFLGDSLLVKAKKSNDMNKLVPIIGILISITLGIYSTDLKLMPIIFIVFYLFIWMQGLKITIDIDGNEDILRKIVFTILIGGLFSIDIILGSIRWYMNDLYPYLILFIVVSLVYLMKSNIYTAYSTMNSINKKKNLRRFSLLSNIILVALIFMIINLSFDFIDLGVLTDKIYPILKTIMYPIVLGVSYILSLLGKFFKLFGFNNEFEPNEVDLDVPEGENPVDMMVTQDPTAAMILTYLGWISVGLIIFGIGYLIYRITKEIINTNEPEDMIIEEEKEFILNRRDIINGIKNKLKRKKSNEVDKESLNIVRNIFLEISLFMIEKGYTFRKNYTPREFISQNKNNIDEVEYIIDKYEGVRYGEKSIPGEEIEKIIQYKNKIMDK